MSIPDRLTIARKAIPEPNTRPPPLRLIKKPLISPRILESPFLSMQEKTVYIAICHHTGKRGYADVSYQQLADDFGLTRNSVRHTINKLVRVDVIKRVRRKGTRSIYYPVRSTP